jgi:hypothetical protein
MLVAALGLAADPAGLVAFLGTVGSTNLLVRGAR